MKQVAFTNDTDKTIPIGSKSVRPGETREVDPSMIPGKWKKKAHGLNVISDKEEITPLNPILSILDESIPYIVIAISEKDDDGNFKYSIDDLSALEQAEQAGNTRKGVIEGLNVERIARADVVTEIENFVKELAESSNEDLIAALDLYKDDEGKLALVQAEIDSRSAKELSEMSDEDLTAALDFVKDDEGKLALVRTEIDKRANA